ncbi:MAG: aspartate carbamoyltransferase regulatory subunit [Candidatus Hodarchaeota archaeon]
MNESTGKTKKQLTVQKIDNGIVIDHITPPGWSFYALKILNIDESFPHSVYLAINVPSAKLGRKDLIKIRNIAKKDLDLEKLGLVIAGSNIIDIRDYNVVEKQKIEAPDKVTGAIKCPGLHCITSLREDVQPEFKVISKNHPVQLRCNFCDKIFNPHENISLLI